MSETNYLAALITTQEQAENILPKQCEGCKSERTSVTIDPLMARFKCGSGHDGLKLVISDVCRTKSRAYLHVQSNTVDVISQSLKDTHMVKAEESAEGSASQVIQRSAASMLFKDLLSQVGVQLEYDYIDLADLKSKMEARKAANSEQHGTIVLEIPDADEEEK